MKSVQNELESSFTAISDSLRSIIEKIYIKIIFFTQFFYKIDFELYFESKK